MNTIKLWLGSDHSIELSREDAQALVGLLCNHSRVSATVEYLRGYLAGACEPKTATPEVIPTVPTVSPGSTPCNSETAKIREARETAQRHEGKTTSQRSRKRQATVKEVSAMLSERGPEPLPSETVVPSAPVGKPLPEPTATLAVAKRQGLTGKPKPVSPVKTLVRDFVVPLPDGRETYVAVYSDGSVVHETSAGIARKSA